MNKKIRRLPETVFVDPKKCKDQVRPAFVCLPKKDAEYIANLAFYPYSNETQNQEISKPKTLVQKISYKVRGR